MEILLCAVLAVVCTLTICRLALSDPRDTQAPAQDPCESCLRWPECNGADMDVCPLWEEARRGEK